MLSLVLLIAVGLLLTSFARLQQVKPGFEPGGVFTAQLVLPPGRYEAETVQWELVGIDPELIDPDLVE